MVIEGTSTRKVLKKSHFSEGSSSSTEFLQRPSHPERRYARANNVHLPEEPVEVHRMFSRCV